LPAPKRRDRAAEQALTATYDGDYYSWTRDQARLLREGRFGELDAANLAEEVDDLGRELLHKLESAYRVIALHLLKWDHQPDRRSRSWAGSIKTHRLGAKHLLDDNPGLKPRSALALRRAYGRARVEAAAETGIDEDAFPPECPYSLDDLMTREIAWPRE
jgi:hypothetical protein